MKTITILFISAMVIFATYSINNKSMVLSAFNAGQTITCTSGDNTFELNNSNWTINSISDDYLMENSSSLGNYIYVSSCKTR